MQCNGVAGVTGGGVDVEIVACFHNSVKGDTAIRLGLSYSTTPSTLHG
jgi:hypothetical protein